MVIEYQKLVITDAEKFNGKADLYKIYIYTYIDLNDFNNSKKKKKKNCSKALSCDGGTTWWKFFFSTIFHDKFHQIRWKIFKPSGFPPACDTLINTFFEKYLHIFLLLFVVLKIISQKFYLN
jgi:hypothetical protein